MINCSWASVKQSLLRLFLLEIALAFVYESWQLPSSPAQRNEKKKKKKERKKKVLNQGGPNCDLKLYKSGDVISHSDFLESFLWFIILTIADSVAILSHLFRL